MRTTVTLDVDVKALLDSAAHRSGLPFRVVLNDAVRSALTRSAKGGAARPEPPLPRFEMGSPLVDLTKALALADELEDQLLASKLGAGR
jgi:hypothetical protein